jgi:hypothetical protein
MSSPLHISRTLIRLIATSALFAQVLVSATSCGSPTVTPITYQVGVVECGFADQGGTMELPQSYYNALYGSGPGTVADYFAQVSYHQAAVNFTVFVPYNSGSGSYTPYPVSGAYTSQYYGTSSAPMTLNQFQGLSRGDEITTCLGAAADAKIDLKPYQALIALQVNQQDNAPYKSVTTTLATSASPNDMTLQVQPSTGFPPPPFPALIAQTVTVGTKQVLEHEEVEVTAESGANNTTWTVKQRALEGSAGSGGTALSLDSGDQVTTAWQSGPGANSYDTSVKGNAQTITVGTTHQETLTAGFLVMDPLGDTASQAHELLHALFNVGHARDIPITDDYSDDWDVMGNSGDNYNYTPLPQFAIQGGWTTAKEHYTWAGGPGLNATILDYLGWIGPSQEDIGLLTARSCASHGLSLTALSQTAGGLREVRLPYKSQNGSRNGFPDNGQYYTVEFRTPAQGPSYTTVDSQLPEPAVLIHLAVQPDAVNDPHVGYLVDTTVDGALEITGADPGGVTGTPQFIAGSTFMDLTSSAYLAVNDIVVSSGTAHVTAGNCLLPTKLTNLKATSQGPFESLLSATLMTAPSSGVAWPVPNQLVTLYIGKFPGGVMSCTKQTDSMGNVACPVTVNPIGQTTETAEFDATAAYDGASISTLFLAPTPAQIPTPPGQ